MALSLVASTNFPNGTSGSIDTTGANLIVILGNSAFGGLGTPSDNKSNTWTALTEYGGNYKQRIWYCSSPTVGSGHTFSASISFGRYSVLAFSGAETTSVFTAENGGTDGGTGVDTIQTGSVTPNGANDLFVAGCYWEGTTSTNSSVNSGFTEYLDTEESIAAMNVAYLIASGDSSAKNPVFSSNPSSTFRFPSVVIATFKAASVPPGSLSPRLTLLGVG